MEQNKLNVDEIKQLIKELQSIKIYDENFNLVDDVRTKKIRDFRIVIKIKDNHLNNSTLKSLTNKHYNFFIKHYKKQIKGDIIVLDNKPIIDIHIYQSKMLYVAVYYNSLIKELKQCCSNFIHICKIDKFNSNNDLQPIQRRLKTE